MKAILLFFVLLISTNIQAQTAGEKINWQVLKVYTAKTFEYKNDRVSVKYTNCKLLEIESLAGTTGYYVVGEGTIELIAEKTKDKIGAVLIRFNPEDVEKMIKLDEKEELADRGFKSHAMIVLTNIFKRSFHVGMDALIPDAGEFTCNFFGAREGDVMVTFIDGTLKITALSR